MFTKAELERNPNPISRNAQLAAHHYHVSKNAANRGFTDEAKKHGELARKYRLADMDDK